MCIFLLITTEPSEKKFLTLFNNSKSLICKVILKQDYIVQPIELVLDLKIDIQKDPYVKPVTHQGLNFILVDKHWLLVLLYLIFFKTLLLDNFN